MQALKFYAGKTARSTIRQHGLKPELFSAILGASGGPKWFSLTGLDKVIFPQFFVNHKQHIDIMGSSAGAFRAACMMQDNVAEAIDRLAMRYSATEYSEKPSNREITEKGKALLAYMLGDKGVTEILKQANRSVHFFVAHCHGWVSSENTKKQTLGLLKAASRNLISRKHIASHFTRAVFSSAPNTKLFIDEDNIPSDFYQLDQQNLMSALMASGSIPIVLEGVENIPNAKPGMYRDGGIIDYHFDLRLQTPGLVMYPHFYSTPTPGWFDKNIKYRQCRESSYDNVLMLVPSDEFVASLPYGKIPDRKDFETMPAAQRIAYWRQVIAETDRLGEEFLAAAEQGKIMDLIEPINLARR